MASSNNNSTMEFCKNNPTIQETSSNNSSQSMEDQNWKYKDGWPEDKWQQEFDSHPFFMSKSPEPAAELHPLLEGLQQLKYGEEDNTADDLAETYKNDGLLSFKVGKYRDAILNFNTALKYNCSNELKSQLFNNRAASNFFLANYRSALQDSREAVKLNPDYLKAKLRIPHCLHNLESYQECIDACDEILSQNKDDTKILELRKSAVQKKKLRDRDKRKQQKKVKDETKLIEAINDRKLRIRINGENLNSVSQLDPPASCAGLERVYLKDNSLIWSAIIAFPECRMFESIKSFHEDVSFSELLEEIFEAIHTDWDKKRRYKNETVNIYFKDENLSPIKIPISWSLLQAQRHPKYYQESSVPQFFIVVGNSEAEKEFLQENLHNNK